jgi:Fic family protein
MIKPTLQEVTEFLKESNAIEREYSEIAFMDALNAWNFAYPHVDNINLAYIKTIHNLLMRRLRPDIAGKLRNCDVMIAGVRKRFYHEELLKEQLEKVIYRMNFTPNKHVDKERFTKATHIQFEKVHSFEDGNGRVGRILYNTHRLKLGLPLHIIYEKDKYEYYRWFK